MRASFRFALTLLAALPSTALAQEDTAHHRAVYAEIEKNAASYRRARATFTDEPTVFQLQGWFDGRVLRKIVATVPGEDGDGSEEYYLENGQPLFVFRRYRSAGGQPGKATTIEDRFYFTAGRLIKWMGSGNKPVAPRAGDFKAEAERLATNATNFLGAFQGKAPAADAAQSVIGTFLGLEKGDYMHWLLRTDFGETRSFFILRPDPTVDKVIAEPRAYIGRKCRVQWKQSTENIPEAGGKIAVEQILSVEWIGKD